MSDYHTHGHSHSSTRESGYHSVFDRLSVTETQSSAGKRQNSPRGKSSSPQAFSAFSGHAIQGSCLSARSYGSQQPSIQPSISSSSRLVSPKIFDRLANTETFASAQMKGKIAERKRAKSAQRSTKSSNAFFDRMAYTETFASAQMKGLIDASSKKKSNGEKSHSGRSIRSKAKAMGSSFWDRMSKTETYASATMKGNYIPPNQRSSTTSSSPRSYVTGRISPSAKSTSSRSRKGYTTSSFFDRLSKTETLSSMQKKKNQSAADAARNYHGSSPSYKQKKPMYLGGSSSISSTPRKYSSPSNRSVGSTRSRASAARSVARSVATTKSATTARSLGTNTTVRSNNTLRSNRSMYAVQHTRRTTDTPTSRSDSESALLASRRPPPSPKAKAFTTKRNIPPVRASSSSPRQMYGNNAPLPASTASALRRPRPQPPTKTLAPKPKPKSALKPKPAPKPKPKPAPAPRPVLHFDDDDELSFGSEDSDEASLGPASVKAPQDAGSVASKSITSKKESSTVADSSVLAATSMGVARVTAGSAALTAPSVSEEGEEERVQDQDEAEEEIMEVVEESASTGYEETIQGVETEDFLDELEQQSEGASEGMESEHEHSKQEDVNFPEEDHIDDFLDDLESGNEPESHEEPEEEEEHNQQAEIKEEKEEPRIPLVHESDDELSFGSDDEDDDWLGNGAENNEAAVGVDEANVPIKDANPEPPKEPEVDAADDVDSILDPQENTADENGEVDVPMEDEQIMESEHNSFESKLSEEDVDPLDEQSMESKSSFESKLGEEDVDPLDEQSMESKSSFESELGEDEMQEGQDYEQEDSEDEAEDVDYNDDDGVDYEKEEDIDEEPQMVEEEYNEQEDLDHMDSLDLVLDATGTGDYHEETVDGEDEFDANMADHIGSKYKILKSEKYHPEYGLEEVHPDDLYLKETLQCFEDGDISNEEIAVLIIEALFEKDFENGDHWELDAGTARELEEDEGGGGDLDGCAFVVKRQARLDWNDLYSVAAAKGTITIDLEKNEIRVENYSYFVAG